MSKKILITLLAVIAALIFAGGVSYASLEENPEETSPLKGSAAFINIKSDVMEYFHDKDQFVATGNVIITVEEDGTVIKSDEVIFDKLNNLIISEKNVKIIKGNTVIDGDYARFDLNKESALINNPDTYLTQIKIDSNEAIIHSGNVELLKGKVTALEEDMVLVLSAGSGGRQTRDFLQKRPEANPKINYDVKAKEIIVEDRKDSKIITMRNASISLNRFKIAKIPELKMTTSDQRGYLTFKRSKKTGLPVLKMEADKNSNRIETMLPEFGHRPDLGSYLGYGHVFNLPKGSTLKALPIFTWGSGESSNIGLGGMGRFMSATNETELLYSSLKDLFVISGEQRIFSPNTKIQYSTFSFIENGFFGEQKPSYLLEIVDDRVIVSGYNMRFSLRSSAGLIEAADGNYATGRYQLQGQLNNINPLWQYKENLAFGFDSNFHIAAYGSGHSYGVARIAPTVFAGTDRFNAYLAYYRGAFGGETPFFFDQYVYGKSNLFFRGSTEITSFLSLGCIVSLNLTKDNWEEELVTENQIFVWLGPSDLKFKIGYDVERERTVFGFDMVVGSETSAMEFEKLKLIQR